MNWKLALAAGVCLLAGMTNASAQVVESIKVSLPFAATVGGVSLPAGEYTVRDLSSDSPLLAVVIRSTATGASVTALVSPVANANQEASEQSAVVLRRTEKGYQWDTIRLKGQELSYALVTTGGR